MPLWMTWRRVGRRWKRPCIGAISHDAASGDYSSSTCGSILDGFTTCTIYVAFTPSIPGPDNGTLTVIDDSNNVSGSTQTASLTGTGVATTATVPPAGLKFGNQALATPRTARTVTVKNTGTGIDGPLC